MFEHLVRSIAVLTAMLIADSLRAEVSVEQRLAEGQPPVIGAWRATGGELPESTLAGIQYSLDRGLDIIDVHVRLTSDGRHVVFHHARLNKNTDVETVFHVGPSGGPTREQRGGDDYIRDYTYEEVQRLRLYFGDELTDHGIPLLEDALDLVGDSRLVVLNLWEFDLEGLQGLLAQRPRESLLVYNLDPKVVREVVASTGVAGYTSISRSRLFERATNMEILEAAASTVGDDLALVHIRRASLITPEILARTQELGVRISVSGYGKEDMYLKERSDASPWRETLDSGASVFWTTEPDKLLSILER